MDIVCNSNKNTKINRFSFLVFRRTTIDKICRDMNYYPPLTTSHVKFTLYNNSSVQNSFCVILKKKTLLPKIYLF